MTHQLLGTGMLAAASDSHGQHDCSSSRDARQYEFLTLDLHQIVVMYVGHPMSLVSKGLLSLAGMLAFVAERDAEKFEDAPDCFANHYGVFAVRPLEVFISIDQSGLGIKAWRTRHKCIQTLAHLVQGSKAALEAQRRIASAKGELVQQASYVEDDLWGRTCWEMDLQFPKPSQRLAKWSLACHSERFIEGSLLGGFVLTRFGSNHGCTPAVMDLVQPDLRLLSWSVEPSHPLKPLVQVVAALRAAATVSIRLDECDPEPGQEHEAVLRAVGCDASKNVAAILHALRSVSEDPGLNQSVSLDSRVRSLSVNFLVQVVSPHGVRGEVHAKLWLA